MSRPHSRPSLRWGPAAALASLWLAGAATPALAGGHHHRGKTERVILVPAPRVVVLSPAPTRTTVRIIEREVYRVASTSAAPAPTPAGRDMDMERSLEGLAKSMPAPTSPGERGFASSQGMENSLQGYVDRGQAAAPQVIERVYVRQAAPVVERVYIREAPAIGAILIERAPKHRLFHHKD